MEKWNGWRNCITCFSVLYTHSPTHTYSNPPSSVDFIPSVKGVSPRHRVMAKLYFSFYWFRCTLEVVVETTKKDLALSCTVFVFIGWKSHWEWSGVLYFSVFLLGAIYISKICLLRSTYLQHPICNFSVHTSLGCRVAKATFLLHVWLRRR